MIIVGFSVFFGVGSVLQSVMIMVVTVAYLMLVLNTRPYQDENGKFSNNALAVADQVALFIVLLQVVMVKYVVATEAVATPAYHAGYNTTFINLVLVSVVVAVAMISNVLIAKDVYRAVKDVHKRAAEKKAATAKPAKPPQGDEQRLAPDTVANIHRDEGETLQISTQPDTVPLAVASCSDEEVAAIGQAKILI